MYQPLDKLPDALLDRLVSAALSQTPSSRVSFLASLGTRVHASSVRVLFGLLDIPDDAKIFDSAEASHKSMMAPILVNPERYAHAIKSITVQQPIFESSESVCPLDSHYLTSILEACCNLEAIVWNSPFVPPDGICETIASYSPRLSRFIITGRNRLSPSEARNCLPKWDAPSLPLLSASPLTSLHLSRLSQAGARALSSLLSSIGGEYSLLEDVSFDIVWLDDALCEKLVEAGRRIRTLKLGTRGTKLSDRGIVLIAEGCENLEDFILEEVQGRLSRALWTKPIHYSPVLKRFRIAINEASQHHSWTTDHLDSLYAIPFPSLKSFSLVRIEPELGIINGIPVYDTVIDDNTSLRPVPDDFVNGIRAAKSLSTFECDWWGWSIANMKTLIESCNELETIKICLDAPFSKLLTLTSSFASLPNLRKLSICVNPVHAPGLPPVPLVPLSQSLLPTPAESPVLKAKSVLPQLLDFDQMHTRTCLATSVIGDPSMPVLREVKRFVRKCPKLNLFEWYGKYGRGSWTVTRPPSSTSKASINILVDYNPPSIPEDVWHAMIREKNNSGAETNEWISTVERSGQIWTGPKADAMAAEQAAENEKEEGASIGCNDKEKHGKQRGDGRRKARMLSVSTTSNSGDNGQLPTPTSSSYSPPPSSKYPPLSLSPHQSETSISTPLSSVSETVESTFSTTVGHSEDHRRAPSEPNSSPTKTSTHWRTRSSSGVTKDKGERQDYFSKGTNSTTSHGAGSKAGKRTRGGSTSAARGFKKRSVSGEGERSGGQETESSRRGRGGTQQRGSSHHSYASGNTGNAQGRKRSSRRSSD